MATTIAHAKARVVDSFSDKTAVVVFSSSIPSLDCNNKVTT